MREQRDSFTTGKKHPTLQQAIRRSLLMFGLGIGIIGLCGLATITSETTSSDDPGLSASWKSVDPAPAKTDSSSALTAQPFSAVAPLSEPTSAKENQSTKSNTKKAPTCDTKKRTTAIQSKRRTLSAENSRHHQVVGWLKTSSLFTRYFAPGVYTAKLQAEQQKHSKNTTAIMHTYGTALKVAYCNQ